MCHAAKLAKTRCSMRHAPLLEPLSREDGIGEDRSEGLLLPRSEGRTPWRKEPSRKRRPEAANKRPASGRWAETLPERVATAICPCTARPINAWVKSRMSSGREKSKTETSPYGWGRTMTVADRKCHRTVRAA